MLFSKIRNLFKIIKCNESGLTIVETIAATALLGIITTSLLSGLALTARSNFSISRLSRAEAIVISQIDFIKASNYIDYSIAGHDEYGLITVTPSYTIQLEVQPIDPDTGQPLSPEQDSGIQLLTVTVAHLGENITSLEGYKVNR